MRYSTRILMFLIMLNAGANFLVASGVAEDWNIEPNPGGDDRIDQANETASQFEPGGGFADTLFGLYSSIAGTFSDVVGVATAAPTMIQNLGVPGYVTSYVLRALYILVGIDMVYLLTIREL